MWLKDKLAFTLENYSDSELYIYMSNRYVEVKSESATKLRHAI